MALAGGSKFVERDRISTSRIFGGYVDVGNSAHRRQETGALVSQLQSHARPLVSRSRGESRRGVFSECEGELRLYKENCRWPRVLRFIRTTLRLRPAPRAAATVRSVDRPRSRAAVGIQLWRWHRSNGFHRSPDHQGYCRAALFVDARPGQESLIRELLIPERFYRIELRGSQRRYHATEHSDNE